MLSILHTLWMFVIDFFKPRWRLQAENLFLRHQLGIALKRVLTATVVGATITSGLRCTSSTAKLSNRSNRPSVQTSSIVTVLPSEALSSKSRSVSAVNNGKLASREVVISTPTRRWCRFCSVRAASGQATAAQQRDEFAAE
jgi:hypothetical protein